MSVFGRRIKEMLQLRPEQYSQFKLKQLTFDIQKKFLNSFSFIKCAW